ncbi:SirB1 family protein [Nitrososphaera sp.]|uniref:SirB1 family protein n=1 Tax=Nitrososphaera sp. TaxID=1971748 RepID=UPI001821448F|nr:transglutaminase-like domain-containing protein [Nitrososphaera sp.]NWG37309.1 tetratricopeptide repeat protein [Nitrososphaera sp.]
MPKPEELVSDWKRSVVDDVIADRTDDLARFALHAARILAYPDLDVNDALRKVDDMGRQAAESAKKKLATPRRPTQVIEHINSYLFETQKFRPNTDDYYNPLNSYLNVVMERKTGIPITLCILYMRVAGALDFQLLPINFPSHFLLKHVMEGGNGEIVIDPFNGGRIMDDYALKALLERSYPGRQISLTRAFVEKTTASQAVIRLLNNLKGSYYESQDMDKYELANEMVLAIDQYNPDAIRDRGIVLLKKGLSDEAASALNMYLEVDPEAEDADDVLDIIRQIRSGTYGKK